jgi:hypothetical protein
MLLDPDPDPNSACGSETLVTDVGFRIFGLKAFFSYQFIELSIIETAN